MQMLLDALSWMLLLAGSLLTVTGGIGLLRLPDFFTRLHAVSIPDTLGAGLIFFGLALQAGWSQVTFKLAMIMLFMFITGPAATHALAKASLHGKLKPLVADAEEKESNSS